MIRMSQMTKQGVQFGVSLLPHGPEEVLAIARRKSGLDAAHRPVDV